MIKIDLSRRGQIISFLWLFSVIESNYEFSGISLVHYLIFSDNSMVRRAATETLCNLSGHESLLKVLRSEEKLKLWLGLAEDWNGDNDSIDECFKAARAAIATVAMAASDPDVVKALINLNCIDTIVIVLESKHEDMVQRVLFLINQMLTDESAFIYLQNQKLLDSLTAVNNDSSSAEVKEIAMDIQNTLI